MMKKVVALLMALMAMIGLLSVAFAKEGNHGRFIENEVQLPDSLIDVRRLSKSENGKLVLMTRTMDQEAMITYMDGTWIETQAVQIAARCIDIANYDGKSYALISQVIDGQTSVDLVCIDSDIMEPVGVDLSTLRPSRLAITKKGILLIQSYGECILIFDPQIRSIVERCDEAQGAFVVSNDELFAISLTRQSIIKYNAETGLIMEEFINAPVTGRDALAYDNGTVYLSNANGIFRTDHDHSEWEQIINAESTSVAQPQVMPISMDIIEGDIYILLYRGDEPALYRYYYDENAVAEPKYVLDAYSLEESVFLTQVARQYEKLYPACDVRIRTTTSTDVSTSSDDSIRAINTELLSGSGPDLLLLDGMPLANYVEKGFLYNLDPLIDDLNRTDELIPAVFDSLSRDTSYFFVPTACYLPVLFDASDSRNNLQALSDVISQVEDSSIELPIPWRTKEGYFMQFLPASYPAWFSDGGQLDEVLFTQYLEFIDALYSRTYAKNDNISSKLDVYLNMINQISDSDRVMNGKIDYPFDLLRLADGRSLIQPSTLGSYKESMVQLSAVRDVGIAIRTMPGQVRNPYIPIGLLGVNAHSKQIDAALEFVRFALSCEAQDMNTYSGLPINSKSLSNQIRLETDASSFISGGYDPETGSQLLMIGEWPTRSQREQIGTMLNAVITPCIPDEQLVKMMTQELMEYFDGRMDAQSAAKMVAAKMRAYLAE